MGSIESYSDIFPDMLMPMWHFVNFWLGCCIGSFLNVCIWRIPNGMSIVTPPSRCPKCGHHIAWYENIPLVSWVVLGGKCSSCHCKISSRYFFVELLCGVLFYLLWFKTLIDSDSISLLLMNYTVTSFILAMAFIDYDHRIIPDKLTYPMMLFGLAIAPVFPGIWGTDDSLRAFLYSAASLSGAGVIMYLLALGGRVMFKQDALGMGDVKYMMAVAACLGPVTCFFTLLIGSLLGAFTGLALIALKKGKMKSAIPFGPFLAGGTYLWMLYGSRFEILYKELFRHFQL